MWCCLGLGPGLGLGLWMRDVGEAANQASQKGVTGTGHMQDGFSCSERSTVCMYSLQYSGSSCQCLGRFRKFRFFSRNRITCFTFSSRLTATVQADARSCLVAALDLSLYLLWPCCGCFPSSATSLQIMQLSSQLSPVPFPERADRLADPTWLASVANKVRD